MSVSVRECECEGVLVISCFFFFISVNESYCMFMKGCELFGMLLSVLGCQ